MKTLKIILLNFLFISITWAIPNPFPSVSVKQGIANKNGTPLTLKFFFPSTLTIKKLYWNEKSQAMDLEIIQLKKEFLANETYSFNFLPDGDIPNLELCVETDFKFSRCWKPDIGGKEGGSILDSLDKEGFFVAD